MHLVSHRVLGIERFHRPITKDGAVCGERPIQCHVGRVRTQQRINRTMPLLPGYGLAAAWEAWQIPLVVVPAMKASAGMSLLRDCTRHDSSVNLQTSINVSAEPCSLRQDTMSGHRQIDSRSRAVRGKLRAGSLINKRVT